MNLKILTFRSFNEAVDTKVIVFIFGKTCFGKFARPSEAIIIIAFGSLAICYHTSKGGSLKFLKFEATFKVKYLTKLDPYLDG